MTNFTDGTDAAENHPVGALPLGIHVAGPRHGGNWPAVMSYATVVVLAGVVVLPEVQYSRTNEYVVVAPSATGRMSYETTVWPPAHCSPSNSEPPLPH